jgi:hypothetical protein
VEIKKREFADIAIREELPIGSESVKPCGESPFLRAPPVKMKFGQKPNDPLPMANESSQKRTPQIGIILCVDIAQQAVPALKYLLLRLNTLQSSFEYQILPTSPDKLLTNLASGKRLDRNAVLADLKTFSAEYSRFLDNQISLYKIPANRPDHYIIVSRATFEDEYYMTGSDHISILALGNWERYMAPPSLGEFIISLVLSSSTYALPNSIQGLTHFGTKGCLFDFNPDLENARFMSLQGFVCCECRSKLEARGYPQLADELQRILEKNWLGSVSEVNSSAAIASKLGYNLFLTKGLVPRWWERSLAAIEQEWIKELIKLIYAVLLAAILVYLGLKKLGN